MKFSKWPSRLVAPSLLSIGIVALALAAVFTSARPTEAAADGLTWKISQHAFTSSSLAPAHTTGAPAVKDPVNGFVFPTDDSYFDQLTHAMSVQFDGSATLGNINQGGYRIMFDNPSITVDGNGDGVVYADLTYCVSTADCMNPWIGPAVGIRITTFHLNPGDITDTGSHVEFTTTPFWATVGNQFDQELIDTLPASLRGHFRATGSPSDSNKPPALMTVSFDYVVSVGGEVTMDVFSTDSSNSTMATWVIAAAAMTGVAIGGVVVTRRARKSP